MRSCETRGGRNSNSEGASINTVQHRGGAADPHALVNTHGVALDARGHEPIHSCSEHQHQDDVQPAGGTTASRKRTRHGQSLKRIRHASSMV